MLRPLIVFLIIYANTFHVFADSLRVIREITLPEKHPISIDALGYIYQYSDREITKLDSLASPLYTFSNNTLGIIHSIDVINPLELMVFYKLNAQVVLLDNTLSEQNKTINLNSFSLQLIDLTANSMSNDGFWTYSKNDHELQKRDQTSNILTRSGNLNLLTNQTFSVNEIKEFNNFVLAISTAKAFVFDNRLNYKKRISLNSEKLIHYQDEFYITQKQNEILIYDQVTYDQRSFSLDFTPEQILFQNQTLYLKRGKSLLVCQY